MTGEARQTGNGHGLPEQEQTDRAQRRGSVRVL